MNRRLVIELVLPLVAATLLSVLLHRYWPADGFFLNLSAGFVGSLVTVGYIDLILRRHEQENWKETDIRIKRQLSKLASATITGVRTSFGYGTEVFNSLLMLKGTPEVMQKEIVRVATHVLCPAAEARIKALNKKQWRSFAAHLNQSSVECGVLLDRFSNRLDPYEISLMLDLQHHLETAQTYWRLFPDVAGASLDEVPHMNTPPEAMQAGWCEVTAREVRKVLELSVKLSEETSGAQPLLQADA